MEHLIELWPGDWEEQLGELINRFVRRIDINRNMGRHGLLQNYLKMSSEILGGAFFWRLPTGRNDTGFGGKVKDITKGRTRVEWTEVFIIIHI